MRLFKNIKISRVDVAAMFRASGRRVGRRLSRVALILIIHLMLGYRRLRDIDATEDDPVVLRALSLKRMPQYPLSVRILSRMDRGALKTCKPFMRELVLERLMNGRDCHG